jgi:hypothetical protein
MRASVVIELDPVGDDVHRMLLGLEAVAIHALPFEIRVTRATKPCCCGRCGVLSSCWNPQLNTTALCTVSWLRRGHLSERSRNGFGTRPRLPYRLTSACSSAAAAVVALAHMERRQPCRSRILQSIKCSGRRGRRDGLVGGAQTASATGSFRPQEGPKSDNKRPSSHLDRAENQCCFSHRASDALFSRASSTACSPHGLLSPLHPLSTDWHLYRIFQDCAKPVRANTSASSASQSSTRE